MHLGFAGAARLGSRAASVLGSRRDGRAGGEPRPRRLGGTPMREMDRPTSEADAKAITEYLTSAYGPGK